MVSLSAMSVVTPNHLGVVGHTTATRWEIQYGLGLLEDVWDVITKDSRKS